MADPTRSVRQLRDRALDGEVADARVGDAGEGVPHPELLLVEDVLDAAHRAARDLALRASADDRLAVVARCPRVHDGVHFVAPFEPRPLELETFVVGELRLTHHLREAGEHLVVGARDRHPAPVRAGVVAVRCRGVGLGPASLADVSGLVVDRRNLVEEPEDAVVQPDVDELTAPGLLSCAQRQQHAEGAVETGQVVGQRRRSRDKRRGIGLAGDVGEARVRLRDACETGQAGLRPGLAVGGDAQHHELRIDREQIGEPEAPSLHRPRPKVLDDHVGRRRESPEELRAALVLEVQRDAPLVARVVEPPVGVARLAWSAEAAQVVADARALDLDDVGPELRETGAGERRGDEGGDIEHPDVVERHDRACHWACSRVELRRCVPYAKWRLR